MYSQYVIMFSIVINIKNYSKARTLSRVSLIFLVCNNRLSVKYSIPKPWHGI